LGAAPARTHEELERQARALLDLGPAAVLLKGGHASGDTAADLLAVAGEPTRVFSAPRVRTALRGTGCALASAIAAGLAQGLVLAQACEQGKRYVTKLLRARE
jgi:hydroxymethylpyrimidine/phosphomethylpyrimidine kinase